MLPCPSINLGVLVEIALILALVYVPPLESVFSTGPLPIGFWAVLVPIPFLFFLIEELRKWLVRRTTRPAVGAG